MKIDVGLLQKMEDIKFASKRHNFTLEELWEMIPPNWDVYNLNLKDIEEKAINEALLICNNVQKDAAELLGISPRMLCYKLKLRKQHEKSNTYINDILFEIEERTKTLKSIFKP